MSIFYLFCILIAFIWQNPCSNGHIFSFIIKCHRQETTKNSRSSIKRLCSQTVNSTQYCNHRVVVLQPHLCHHTYLVFSTSQHAKCMKMYKISNNKEQGVSFSRFLKYKMHHSKKYCIYLQRA